MVRQRKWPCDPVKRPPSLIRKSSRNKSLELEGRWIPQFLWIGSGLILILLVGYLVHLGYYDSRINTPFNAPRVISPRDVSSSRYWGSYRSGLYFGMKTMSPKDVVSGLMWMVPELLEPNNVGLRHWAEQGDNLQTFGWVQHDGENFGVQEIVDRTIRLNTSFVKRPGGEHGGEWTARIRVEPKSKKYAQQTISLFYYVGIEEGADAEIQPIFDPSNEKNLKTILGKSSGLGSFDVSFRDRGEIVDHFYASLRTPGPSKYTESVLGSLRLFKQRVVGLDHSYRREIERPDFIVYQVLAQLPFELDVVFKSHSNSNSKLIDFDTELNYQQERFNEKFESTFGLIKRGFDDKAIKFAQAAMSNMIGGIGYFYGQSLVQSERTKQPVKYWEAPLYTAVPSRSFFPRGFLWDEGFHNLLISKWNPAISADILGHWMDLINDEGWIPREQILGLEARAKVPDEFVVQRNRNANPPTFFLTLKSMLDDFNGVLSPEYVEYFERMWPRLVVWYNWFHTTQAGEIPGTYRWRGRNSSAIHELNPKTLTSGLDDYPRASHPTLDERHVDLRCWMAMASKLLADIGKLIGKSKQEIVSTVKLSYHATLLLTILTLLSL